MIGYDKNWWWAIYDNEAVPGKKKKCEISSTIEYTIEIKYVVVYGDNLVKKSDKLTIWAILAYNN